MTERMEEMTETLARDGKRACSWCPGIPAPCRGSWRTTDGETHYCQREAGHSTMHECDCGCTVAFADFVAIPTAVESARERFEAAVERAARARVLRAELAELDDADDEYEAALRALGAAIAAEVRGA